MNWFKLLSLVWGAVMILRWPAMHLFPRAWNRFELGVAYTEKRGPWVLGAVAAGLAVVAYTWYEYVVRPIPYAIVVAVLATLTLIKLSQLLFGYGRFRQFAQHAMVEDRRKLLAINILTALAGIGLVWLGLFVY